MTVEQYFKSYPQAQKVLVVGDDLFHAGYDKSAAKVADAKGLTVETVTRPEGDGKPVAQGKAASNK